jgi:hypothetical protein
VSKSAQRFRVGLAAVILASFSVVPAAAGTFTAFGPENYIRENAVISVTKTFAVRNPATSYTLRLTNGGLVDAEFDKVGNTTVRINGNVVVAPQEFNQTTAVLEKPVALLSVNEITVEVRGKPGGALTAEIIGIDNDQPSITATAAPSANAAGWNTTDVTVSFACDDATSGIASCPSAVTVTAEGSRQVVSGTATDLANNSANANVTLSIDKSPPTGSTSISPAPNASGWNNTDVTVNFQCADGLSEVAVCPAPRTISTHSI